MSNPIRLTATKGVALQKAVAAIADALDSLTTARAAYHDQAGKLTQDEAAARAADIKAQMQALSDQIAAGAQPCPTCGNAPHGRVKTPAHELRGTPVPALWEIRCLTCPETIVPKDDAPDYVDVVQPAARAYGTPAEAVAAWNAGAYLTTVRHV